VDRTGLWDTPSHVETVVDEPAWPSLAQYLDALRESHLLTPQQLADLLNDFPGLGDDDAQIVHNALVARGLLTDYQARRVRDRQTFGLVLGNYRITDWIGSGGMGVVFKAEHVHMKRPVAVKVLLTEDEGHNAFLERFNGEMQALAGLNHPNIVLAFDAGEVDVPQRPGQVLRYLVMEYVPGQNLEQYVEGRGPLAIPAALDFIRQAASGLRHAHEHGLVHRDIKPGNLLVTTASAPGLPYGQVKILDFGLARVCRRRCTEAHVTLGTVDYMAPEQARDARSVDIRADVYALGGTLFWLLTGHRPFPGNRPVVEELLARQFESPPSVRSLRADLPLELDAIVTQMMARDPADRYPTPLSLLAALDDFLEPTRTANALERSGGSFEREHAARVGALASAVALHEGQSYRVLLAWPRPTRSAWPPAGRRWSGAA
jgi:serine/threonine protein kinase